MLSKLQSANKHKTAPIVTDLRTYISTLLRHFLSYRENITRHCLWPKVFLRHKVSLPLCHEKIFRHITSFIILSSSSAAVRVRGISSRSWMKSVLLIWQLQVMLSSTAIFWHPSSSSKKDFFSANCSCVSPSPML